MSGSENTDFEMMTSSSSSSSSSSPWTRYYSKNYWKRIESQLNKSYMMVVQEDRLICETTYPVSCTVKLVVGLSPSTGFLPVIKMVNTCIIHNENANIPLMNCIDWFDFSTNLYNIFYTRKYFEDEEDAITPDDNNEQSKKKRLKMIHVYDLNTCKIYSDLFMGRKMIKITSKITDTCIHLSKSCIQNMLNLQDVIDRKLSLLISMKFDEFYRKMKNEVEAEKENQPALSVLEKLLRRYEKDFPQLVYCFHECLFFNKETLYKDFNINVNI